MAFKESTGTPGSGIMMSADGAPMMSGTWVNPQTGHEFTVRDCFFQDGNFMVQTTDGRMLDYNTIQHYVQTTDKGPKISKQPQTQPKQTSASVPEEVMSEILPEDMEAINGLGNINNTVRVEKETVDPDLVMVEKVLKRHSTPKPIINIDWQSTPTKQIETLVDILGVDPQTITNYYLDKIDVNSLVITVSEAITDYINNVVGAKEGTDEPQKTEKTEKTEEPKKKSKKSKENKK